jgi:hypothetical protein
MDGRGQKTTDGEMDDGQRMPLSAHLVDVRSSESRRGGHQHPRRVPTPGYTVPQMRRPSPRRIPQSGGLAHANGHVIGRRTRETLRGQDWCKGGSESSRRSAVFPLASSLPTEAAQVASGAAASAGPSPLGFTGPPPWIRAAIPLKGVRGDEADRGFLARAGGQRWAPGRHVACSGGSLSAVTRRPGSLLEGPLDVDQR